MSVAPVRYKVLEGDTVFDAATALPKRQWHIRMLTGNSETVVAGEGLDEERSAHAAAESIWLAHAKAFGGWDGTAADRLDVLAAYPVPYTKDSLMPAPKRVTKNPTVFPAAADAIPGGPVAVNLKLGTVRKATKTETAAYERDQKATAKHSKKLIKAVTKKKR